MDSPRLAHKGSPRTRVCTITAGLRLRLSHQLSSHPATGVASLAGRDWKGPMDGCPDGMHR